MKGIKQGEGPAAGQRRGENEEERFDAPISDASVLGELGVLARDSLHRGDRGEALRKAMKQGKGTAREQRKEEKCEKRLNTAIGFSAISACSVVEAVQADKDTR